MSCIRGRSMDFKLMLGKLLPSWGTEIRTLRLDDMPEAATSRIGEATAAALVAAAWACRLGAGGARHWRRHRARPDRLGAWHRSIAADRRRGNSHRRPAANGADTASDAIGTGQRRHVALCPPRARQHRSAVEGYLRERRPDLSGAEARDVLRPDPFGLRTGAERDGAVLFVRTIARSISTPRSSTISSAASAGLQRQGVPVFRRPM